jgi:hypothetical protein
MDADLIKLVNTLQDTFSNLGASGSQSRLLRVGSYVPYRW